MKGTWKGHYKHESKTIPEDRRNQWTDFKINIDQYNGMIFSGTVEDDLATGGTEGIGTITGTRKNNEITFVKQMPVATLLSKDGRRITLKKKHPKLYYSGTMSEDGKKITGTWKFKVSIIWNGIIPLIGLPTKGIWTMQKEE